MRKTKIICTLGPAVDSEDMIRTLIRSGMDAARFNFSHGSHPEHLERLSLLKAVRDAMGRPVATILDTKGPEIRIRNFDTKSISLEAGDTFTLTTREEVGDQTHVSVSYPKLHQEVAPGQEILIDDGLVAIRVDEIRGEDIVCTVEKLFIQQLLPMKPHALRPEIGDHDNIAVRSYRHAPVSYTHLQL